MTVTVVGIVIRRSDGKTSVLRPSSSDDGKALCWDNATQSLTWVAGGAGGVSSVSGSSPIASSGGATPTISLSNDAVVAGKLHATATDVVFGRATAAAGAGEEIALTAAGRALIDDADVAAQRTTLGLGTAATTAATAYDAAGFALVALAPAANITIPAGFGRVVPDEYEVPDGFTTEIGDGATLEVT